MSVKSVTFCSSDESFVSVRKQKYIIAKSPNKIRHRGENLLTFAQEIDGGVAVVTEIIRLPFDGISTGSGVWCCLMIDRFAFKLLCLPSRH